MITQASRRALDVLTRWMAMAGLFAMLLLAAATITDAVLRWAINQPIDAVRDLGALVAAVSMASCLPLVLLARGNITIRFVSAFIRGQPGRLADTFAALCVAAVIGAMIWQFHLFADATARAAESTPLLAVPVAPFWHFVDAVLVVALIVQLQVLVENLAAAIRRPVARAAAQNG